MSPSGATVGHYQHWPPFDLGFTHHSDVIGFVPMWLIREVIFAVMEHFIICQLSFPSVHYFFPTTEYEYCHPTHVFLSHGYKAFFFFGCFFCKKPTDTTQGNFQKLSSIVLLCMFRLYWLESHAVTSERNSFTCVTSWAFITSRVSLISICFFLKAQFSYSYCLDYDL